MEQALITNIGTLIGITDKPRLCGAEMGDLHSIENAYLLIENGKIAAFGKMADAPQNIGHVVDAKGGVVMPSFCDSHTHIVYAGSREQEFIDKMKGLSYEELRFPHPYCICRQP